ncbi:mannitol dehydrogenase family protein [Komagataeibacter medellinensis]|uniref:mannitol dehydrogenase family protein n=1 Tax=Komagataeibacter medellinensis TaxID=1177712 RepID=UPI0038D1B261
MRRTPELEAVGVQFTDNVQPYEEVKLHMLNASHSLLGLSGVLSGYRVVSEIMEDMNEVRWSSSISAMMPSPCSRRRRHGAERIWPPPAASLPQPRHQRQLLRIASDSTSKLAMFVRSTAMGVLAHHRPVTRIAFVVALCRIPAGHDDRGRSMPSLSRI